MNFEVIEKNEYINIVVVVVVVVKATRKIIECFYCSRFLHTRFPQVDPFSSSPRQGVEEVSAKAEEAFRQARRRLWHLHSQVVLPVLPRQGKKHFHGKDPISRQHPYPIMAFLSNTTRDTIFLFQYSAAYY